jgi:hypothetical protein
MTVARGPLRMFYDHMYSLPAISGRLMERPLAGSGQVGMEGSIIYTTLVPSKLDMVRAALDIENTSNVPS